MKTSFASFLISKIRIATVVLCAVSVVSAQCDKDATSEAKTLFNYLKSISGKGILFGQQYPALSWQEKKDSKGERDRCDFFAAAGAYPAIWGCSWERNTEENRIQMLNAHKHHAINTLHWPMSNPVTGGDHKDLKGDPVASILPGGTHHQSFCQSLDELADFFASLKDPRGRPIPVLFRPFHENTGGAHWWSARNCTPDQYKALFRFTVKYLRKTRGVHQLLYVYAPARPSETEKYTLRYPGDNVVDIIAFDNYSRPKTDFSKTIVADCRIVASLANERGKISAIAETGVHNGLQNTSDRNWFTRELLSPILRDPLARQVSYILTWANFSSDKYWVPLRGQLAYEDFVKMIRNPEILLADKLPLELFEATAKP